MLMSCQIALIVHLEFSVGGTCESLLPVIVVCAGAGGCPMRHCGG